MKKIREISFAAGLVLIAAAEPASAHFTLTKPTSWLKEDPAALGGGGPQKGSPCGPGGYDDVKPTPVSGVVTDFHVGETIEVTWTDTVAHPGYFRLALAANRDDLKNPTIVQDNSCNFDEAMVPKTASGNVLADGVLFRSRVGFNAKEGTKFSYMVTLPNEPCDKCTLQVMQVMENDIKALSNCYYFHCADIRILPTGQTGGAGGASTGGSSSGAGGIGVGGASAAGGAMGLGGTLGLGGMTGAAGLLPGPGSGGSVPGGGGASAVGGPPAAASGGSLGAAGAGTASPGAGAGGYGVGGGLNGAATPAAEEDSGCAIATRAHPVTALRLIGGAWLAALLAAAYRRRRGGSRAN